MLQYDIAKDFVFLDKSKPVVVFRFIEFLAFYLSSVLEIIHLNFQKKSGTLVFYM